MRFSLSPPSETVFAYIRDNVVMTSRMCFCFLGFFEKKKYEKWVYMGGIVKCYSHILEANLI